MLQRGVPSALGAALLFGAGTPLAKLLLSNLHTRMHIFPMRIISAITRKRTFSLRLQRNLLIRNKSLRIKSCCL